jgi:hypothetical protein
MKKKIPPKKIKEWIEIMKKVEKWNKEMEEL